MVSLYHSFSMIQMVSLCVLILFVIKLAESFEKIHLLSDSLLDIWDITVEENELLLFNKECNDFHVYIIQGKNNINIVTIIYGF